MTEYKYKVYVIEPQVGWHGFSLVAALDADYANQIIRKAVGEIEKNIEILVEWMTNHYTRFGAQVIALTAILDKVEELKKELAEEENT